MHVYPYSQCTAIKVDLVDIILLYLLQNCLQNSLNTELQDDNCDENNKEQFTEQVLFFMKVALLIVY